MSCCGWTISHYCLLLVKNPIALPCIAIERHEKNHPSSWISKLNLDLSEFQPFRLLSIVGFIILYPLVISHSYMENHDFSWGIHYFYYFYAHFLVRYVSHYQSVHIIIKHIFHRLLYYWPYYASFPKGKPPFSYGFPMVSHQQPISSTLYGGRLDDRIRLTLGFQLIHLNRVDPSEEGTRFHGSGHGNLLESMTWHDSDIMISVYINITCGYIYIYSI